MRRCIPNSDDGLPEPATRFPVRVYDHQIGLGDVDLWTPPAGVTRIDPSASRADTLPSPPAISPARRADGRRGRSRARNARSATPAHSPWR